MACLNACCNGDARRRRDAAERVDFERKRVAFEAWLAKRDGIEPEPVKVANDALTDAETHRLESWLMKHPAAAR